VTEVVCNSLIALSFLRLYTVQFYGFSIFLFFPVAVLYCSIIFKQNDYELYLLSLLRLSKKSWAGMLHNAASNLMLMQK